MSVSLNSVTVITHEADSSTTSTTVVSTTGVIGGFIGLAFFGASFFALERLAFATLFFGFNLLAVCLVALPRTDLEDLRALPRTVDFRFRTVIRFLRRAMMPAYSDQRRNDIAFQQQPWFPICFGLRIAAPHSAMRRA
jgi:hypothetical protein